MACDAGKACDAAKACDAGKARNVTLALSTAHLARGEPKAGNTYTHTRVVSKLVPRNDRHASAGQGMPVRAFTTWCGSLIYTPSACSHGHDAKRCGKSRRGVLSFLTINMRKRIFESFVSLSPWPWRRSDGYRDSNMRLRILMVNQGKGDRFYFGLLTHQICATACLSRSLRPLRGPWHAIGAAGRPDTESCQTDQARASLGTRWMCCMTREPGHAAPSASHAKTPCCNMSSCYAGGSREGTAGRASRLQARLLNLLIEDAKNNQKETNVNAELISRLGQGSSRFCSSLLCFFSTTARVSCHVALLDPREQPYGLHP